MNGGRRPLGYTIIEVMIVLAVSGVMFLIAANFINGKQQKTAFTAGVGEMANRLQDLINQVQSGKYSDIPIACSSAGGGNINISSGSNNQGQNPACVFLGKVIHFSVSGNATNFEVLSLAGSRTSSSGDVATDYSSARRISSLTTTGVVPQNLRVTNVAGVENSNLLLSFAIGFMQSQGVNTDPADGTVVLKSGAQTVSLYYVNGIVQNTGPLTDGNINNAILPSNYANICVTDGTRYAEISIGENRNQLDVKVKHDGTNKVGACA